MAKRWLNALLFLLLALYLLYLSVGPFKRQTVVTCEFTSQVASTPLHFGSRSIAVGKVLTVGSLSGEGRNGLYNYDGSGRVNEAAGGSVHGVVFVAKEGAVDGLGLWLNHPSFGQNQLSIATLNGNGILDRNRSTAFFSTDRTDRLSHPSAFSCRSERNFRHIYERLTSFSWIPFVALLVIAWALMFFAKRKAERTDFGAR